MIYTFAPRASKTDLAIFQEAPLAQSRPTFMPLNALVGIVMR